MNEELIKLIEEVIKQEPMEDMGEGYSTEPCCVFCGKEMYQGSVFEKTLENSHEPNCWILRAKEAIS